MQLRPQPTPPGTLSARTVLAAHQALEDRRRGLWAVTPFLGPAFVAAVAYVDPGNFATNLESGSLYGYRLLWVVVLANLVAMLFQNLSSKLGVATGRSLAELCRVYLPRPAVYALWAVSEVAAMATDLAEFLGASLGLSLLLHMGMAWAAMATGAATYAILQLERWGFRPLESLIGAVVGLIALCYLAESILSHPHLQAVVYDSVVPWLGGQKSLLLAVGIVGATVMPHALYLHSGLTQGRVPARSSREAARIHRFHTVDVMLAMGLAGLINMAMLFVAAATFHGRTGPQGVGLASAYRTLYPLLGPLAAQVFLVALIASGLSSSAVGTLAGQMILQGFWDRTFPVWVRRLVTMVPAMAVVAAGLPATQVLVASQVVLSLVLPVPLVALTVFTSRRDIMGPLVNRPPVMAAAVAAALLLLGLNAMLVAQAWGLSLPFPGGGR
jgi:manganese transport protein